LIKNLHIEHFKSIKELDLDCSRINLFIGEPNTGKSNILEALGLISWVAHSRKYGIKDFIRLRYIQNLFHDNDVGRDVVVHAKDDNISPGVVISFRDNIYNVNIGYPSKSVKALDLRGLGQHNIQIDKNNDYRFIKFYRYNFQPNTSAGDSSYLLPPRGDNMSTLVFSNKELRKLILPFFKNYGFNLVVKPDEQRIEYQKTVDDIVYSYPLELLSDTLLRIIFHTIAMETSENSTLVMEEPESHSFPFYTKYLGERIARDPTNQYFIATHNPYLLTSILEKSKENDVKVFITYYKDYKTKVRELNNYEVCDLLDMDPFLNLHHYIEEV
jgi:hypothetical protein